MSGASPPSVPGSTPPGSTPPSATPLAVVGCGAITESYYLPALAALPQLRAATWLVDPSVERARKLAERFGLPPGQVAADAAALPPGVKAAVNATPSHLHLPTTRALIAQGMKAVLVEKPVAETLADVQALVDEAAAAGCKLGVNQFRRLWPSYGLVRDAVRTGRIGRITRIRWEEGRRFEWPIQTGFMFRRPASSTPWTGRPRGAVLDMGVHIIDTVCWWLDEAPAVTAAALDGQGGPEAHATATLASAGSATVEITVSFLAKLANRFVIEGTEGAIRSATAEYNYVEIQQKGGAWREWRAPARADRVAVATRLLENFAAAAAGTAPLLIDAASTLAPFTVIEAIYDKGGEIVPDCYRGWAA